MLNVLTNNPVSALCSILHTPSVFSQIGFDVEDVVVLIVDTFVLVLVEEVDLFCSSVEIQDVF